jgi:monovalent cation/proton antiporter MnhG/PhaG subunit
MRNVYDRLHYTGPAATVGPAAVAAAVVLEESFSSAGVKAIMVALVLAAANPVVVHATARAVWSREGTK